MTKPFFYILSGFILLGLASCMQRPEKRSETGRTLFSLDSLVQSQEKYLKSMDVTVLRKSGINSDSDVVTFRPDTSFWKNEMSIFSAADIGKPSLYNRYRMETTDSSGLLYTNYEAIDPAINGTTLMSVGRDGSGRIVRIHVIQQEKNFIFKRRRNMNLDFSQAPLSRYNILSGYRVTGFQKMLLRKRTDYRVTVQLKINNAE